MEVYYFEFILLNIGIPTLVVGGLIGNVLSAIVFQRREMRSPFTLFLIGLSIFDSVFLIGRLFIFCYPEITPYFLYYVSFIAQTSSGYFTVAISLERYKGICRPLESYNSLTSKKVLWASFIILCVCILINLPEIYYTTYGLSDELFIMYLIFESVFKVLIPLIILFWTNISIYRVVKKQAKIRDQDLGNSQHKMRERSTYNVLLAVVLIYVFCYFPFIIYLTEEVYYKVISLSNNKSESEGESLEAYKQPTLFWIWLKFTTTLNSSVNFLIYFLLGTKFKKILVLTFVCFCKCQTQRQVSISLTESVRTESHDSKQ